MLTILRHEAAQRDLEEQAIYLAQSSPKAAHRFLDAVEHGLEFLASMPEAFVNSARLR
jgi:plasmid stabilization system protein ParE